MIIEEICQSLAAAYGGDSQYTEAHVGEALAGRRRNAGLSSASAEEAIIAAGEWFAARWPEHVEATAAASAVRAAYAASLQAFPAD